MLFPCCFSNKMPRNWRGWRNCSRWERVYPEGSWYLCLYSPDKHLSLIGIINFSWRYFFRFLINSSYSTRVCVNVLRLGTDLAALSIPCILQWMSLGTGPSEVPLPLPWLIGRIQNSCVYSHRKRLGDSYAPNTNSQSRSVEHLFSFVDGMPKKNTMLLASHAHSTKLL